MRDIQVTFVVLCGVLLAAGDGRMARGCDGNNGQCRSARRCCRPEPACCHRRPCCAVPPSCPADSARPAFEERDLGTFHWHDAPKRWHLCLPADVGKVEVAFYNKGQDFVSLNASFAGVLQVNGQHVIGFRGQKSGGYVFHNYLEDKDYFVHRQRLPTKGRFVDVTTLIEAGSNEFLYYHYTQTPVGLKVRIHQKSNQTSRCPSPGDADCHAESN